MYRPAGARLAKAKAATLLYPLQPPPPPHLAGPRNAFTRQIFDSSRVRCSAFARRIPLRAIRAPGFAISTDLILDLRRRQVKKISARARTRAYTGYRCKRSIVSLNKYGDYFPAQRQQHQRSRGSREKREIIAISRRLRTAMRNVYFNVYFNFCYAHRERACAQCGDRARSEKTVGANM